MPAINANVVRGLFLHVQKNFYTKIYNHTKISLHKNFQIYGIQSEQVHTCGANLQPRCLGDDAPDKHEHTHT